MSERRVELKLSRKNHLHRKAIEKIENYDKRYYYSLTDYIVHAVAAYEEPIPVAESVLRKIIREELKGTGAIVQENPSVVQAVPETQNLMEKVVEGVSTQDQNEEISLDPAALDFMNELGI